ncbi:MAG: hypothetical protein ACYDA0_06125 [Candidatus Dormibacteraceae bacterium]
MGASTALAPSLTIPLPAMIAVAGAAITLIGSALPWVTIFRGTQTLTGWNGNPRYLAGLAVASAALTLLFLWAGRPAAFLRLSALAALIVVAGTAVDLWQIASLISSRAVSARILDPSLGPGPFVMLAGALFLLAVVAIPASAPRVPAGLWPRVMLAGALFTSGWIHLALAPEHLGQATILGLGFLAAGLAQIALAGLLIVRPSNLAYYAVVGLNVTLIVLYAVAVLKGLPFGGDHDHASGLVLGAGEPVDLQGAVSKIVELFSLAAALVLVGRRDARAAQAAAEQNGAASFG